MRDPTTNISRIGLLSRLHEDQCLSNDVRRQIRESWLMRRLQGLDDIQHRLCLGAGPSQFVNHYPIPDTRSPCSAIEAIDKVSNQSTRKGVLPGLANLLAPVRSLPSNQHVLPLSRSYPTLDTSSC